MSTPLSVPLAVQLHWTDVARMAVYIRFPVSCFWFPVCYFGEKDHDTNGFKQFLYIKENVFLCLIQETSIIHDRRSIIHDRRSIIHDRRSIIHVPGLFVQQICPFLLKEIQDMHNFFIFMLYHFITSQMYT